MLVNSLKQSGFDFITFGFLAFVTVYSLYVGIMKVHLYLYKKHYNKSPVHYRNFRIYSSSLISNAPTKTEKVFYRQTNRITYFFNGLLISACLVYVVLCFV